jgi:ribose transport system substrate-binding protein
MGLKKMNCPHPHRSCLLQLCLVGIPLFLAGCEGKPEPQPGPEGSGSGPDQPRIMFVNPWVGHELWSVVANGAKDAAGDFDVDLTIVGPPEGYSETTQMLSQIKIAIGQKYDGVLCHPFIPDSFTPVIEDAREAGVFVVCVADDAPESPRNAVILTDDVKAATAAAEFVLEAMKGKSINIGILSSTPGVPSLDLRINAFRKVVKQAPNVKIIGVQYGYSDMMQNISKVQAQLMAHPEINVLYGTGGDHPPSHAKVVADLGRQDDILIIGFDDVQETLDHIRNGVVDASIYQNHYLWGYLGVKYLAQLARGETVPEITDPGYVVITRENLDDYIQRGKKKAGL